MKFPGNLLRANLTWWLFVAALFLLLAAPAAPLLLRLTVPFPSLDQTRHLVGAIEVNAHHHVGRSGAGSLATIYIQTNQEKVEISCGYLFDRTPCPRFHMINGTQGEVWYHPVYGVVQWRLTKVQTGDVFEIDIDDSRLRNKSEFNSSKYIERLMLCAAFLAAVVYLSRKKQAE